MSTSKKDYVAIARIINVNLALAEDGYTSDASNAIRALAGDLAAYFGDANPRFERARFLEACKPVALETERTRFYRESEVALDAAKFTAAMERRSK